ncbi:ABC transporter permease [Asticcacaulis sp. AC402]|uniref:ABC transporter permease n=1 Tax=Asticcacaulis sp. AC402 TaxID=1282361 RepID=UPI0003C41135|nr:ABC transporter permease [Asticcacaulis sp. AC402]ESQ75983.1 sugar ABC transporter permease [Asticcacaulis sp. AC402]
MNWHAIWVIYQAELGRSIRTLFQSLATPVISTSLYFIVFGSAIGSQMGDIGGVPYGAFIIPGLVMLTLLTESTSNAAFGIYLPRFTGTIYEVLSAPVSVFEVVAGYVGAAATKSVVLGCVILGTARLFVPYEIVHPWATAGFLILISLTFSLFGFVLGVWADGFEKLQAVPMLILSPLAFLGGTFYSIKMLPETWQTVTLFNPVVYLVNGFRWAFYGQADVNVWISLGMTLAFLAVCLAIVAWIFKTGYRLRT